ncbi:MULTISPECIES: CsgG/HfaB family protein [unclassified Mesorhizobium]|uniref:CsgG/HfaB family protein n=1 Tax=unclassified Mesorhizobium TaxID=325217 RepID=UPI001128735D|nr:MULTISPECIES: CsgG/HfaB family protein [unclassified Mesorhizobium]TPN01250.1 curli production assembly protein CsgG [Mesorhizobium sp. B2-1-3A]BCG89003.1 curli production assembly protein CsgG [Mesorhizobium sp. 113-3-9]
MHSFKVAGLLALTGLVLSGCQTGQQLPTPPAHLESLTKTTHRLSDVPAPAVPVDVAVYDFPDLTGQAKPNENFAEYSRAVTQGGANILIDVLKSAGRGNWFRVVERGGLKNLVQERTLIENTQRAYGKGLPNLPPVRFAGLILEGGIVGYDSNEQTGGAGARYLGIGGDVTYRSDLVTISLRAVSVQTGEILVSTTTSKQIYSFEVRGGAYTFAAPTELLEAEIGTSYNDPGHLAVREGMELAVYSLIVQGVKQGLWKLSDQSRAPALIGEFAKTYAKTERPGS